MSIVNTSHFLWRFVRLVWEIHVNYSCVTFNGLVIIFLVKFMVCMSGHKIETSFGNLALLFFRCLKNLLPSFFISSEVSVELVNVNTICPRSVLDTSQRTRIRDFRDSFMFTNKLAGAENSKSHSGLNVQIRQPLPRFVIFCNKTFGWCHSFFMSLFDCR
jgi:hypothetical protein